MSKKLIAACMAIAAFAAFVLPATASAKNTPTLTDAAGHVKVPSLIVGTNIGDTKLKETNNGNTLLSCNSAVVTGTLNRNDSGFVEGSISTAKFEGTGGLLDNRKECTGFAPAAVTPLGLPWSLKSTPLMETHRFEISRSTGAPVEFTLQVTGFFGAQHHCVYKATGPIVGKGTTGTDLVHIPPSQVGSGFTRTAGTFPCPSSGELEMTFTLATDVAGHPPITIGHAP